MASFKLPEVRAVLEAAAALVEYGLNICISTPTAYSTSQIHLLSVWELAAWKGGTVVMKMCEVLIFLVLDRYFLSVCMGHTFLSGKASSVII